MEDQGGISVSDVVAKTTGVRPVPPRDQQDRTDQPGHRAHGAEPAAQPRAAQPPRARAQRPAQPSSDNPAPADATRQPGPPRPRQPRRSTAAAPQPEAPLQRRPPATNPGQQQTSAAQQPPRRLRRPAPAPDGAVPPRPDAPALQRPPGPDAFPVKRPPTAPPKPADGPAAKRAATNESSAPGRVRPAGETPPVRRPPADSPAAKRAAAKESSAPGRARPTGDTTALRRPQADAPAQRPAAAASDTTALRHPQADAPAVGAVPSRAELDPLTMTDEMEAIDEATQYRRKIDHTLARFSAAHDEGNAEEAKRRERRERLSPASLIESTRTALQRVVTPIGGDEPEVDAAELAAQTRLQEKKQRKNERVSRFGRIAAAVVAALVFLGVGGAWGAQTYFDAKFTQISALDENSSDIQDAAAQANDENFLMVGSDTRDGAAAEEGVGTADSTPGARSDTVMVAHIPADRQRVVVTSFPRDLEIDRPDCQRWDPAQNKDTDEKVPGQKIAKLNTAYAVGGPPCITKVIQQITGLRINHFVGIDFNGFKEMVDAVHGVTVHNEIPIDDTILGKVLLETGDVTISGDQALNFVRARHVKGDPTSDYGRIKRQQAFIGALLKKVMSSDVVLDPGKLSDFITAFAKATFGDNLGVKQMMTLAQSMKGLDQSKISFLTVPTVGLPNNRGNEVLVRSKAKALFDALRTNTALPDPNAPIPQSEQPPPSSSSKSSSSKTTSKTSSGSKKTSSTSSTG